MKGKFRNIPKTLILNRTRLRPGYEYGTCSSEFDEDFKPHNVVELFTDETFQVGCTGATNAHGANDPNFLFKVGILGKNDKGRSFIKAFLAIR